MAREFGLGLGPHAQRVIAEYERAMEAFELQKALVTVWDFIGRMNKAIDVSAPWELAKKKTTRKQLQAVMNSLLKGLRLIAGLIYPVMPESAARMQQHLGLDPDAQFYLLEELKLWKPIPCGTQLPKTIMLFPRIETAVSPVMSEAPEAEKPLISKIKPEISIDDFLKVDLRVAVVRHAELVPKAKRLIKLEIELDEPRTIVAGIAEQYTAESLIGRQIIVVANLKPAKLMGILSQGMLLAAGEGAGPVLIMPDKPVTPGTALL
jgi:methionyl-tRNA synthetase